MDYNNSTISNTPTLTENSLRLISINKASKILGIRYQSIRKIVMFGKIKYIRVGKSIRIPYMNLVKFLEGQSDISSPNNVNSLSTEEISKRIDELIAEYSGA